METPRHVTAPCKSPHYYLLIITIAATKCYKDNRSSSTPGSSRTASTLDDDVDDDELLSLREWSDSEDIEWCRLRRNLSSCRRSLPCSRISSSRLPTSLDSQACRFYTQHAPPSGRVTTLQTENNSRLFLRLFWTKLQAICRKNANLLTQIVREHHVWKMNYSTSKVQVSHFVELPQSNFPDYRNPHTFPWLWDFSLTFPCLSQVRWHFPSFQKFPKSGNPGPSVNSTHCYTPLGARFKFTKESQKHIRNAEKITKKT